MKKSVSILFCFLVMILSISAVSAADMDLDPELALPKSDVGIGASDGEVLADDGSGDFTSLQNSIDDDGSTLILTSDYKRVDGDSDVSITKDVTILGNNHKIDADKKGGIFKVNTGCTLTLIGVTLINGNNENGGAIYNDGGVLNIVNSQLINNTATESGGAIYNAKSSSIYVSSSTFDGNDLTDRHFNGWGGAAIYNDGGSIIMDDCRVTNNLKNIVHRGGTGNYAGDLSSAALASYNDGSVIITNSYFANNSGSYGGAILFDKGVLDIRNTAFVNNFAFNGGAIDIIDGTYTISNCTFKENNAKGTGSTINNNAHGGALCIVYETAGECVVSDCIFEDNSAVYGGAVSNSNAKFVNCTFINNTASASNSETFNGKRNNRGGFGGAIYSDKQITVIDSNFTNNTSRSYGLYIKNADISGSSFNNSAINVVGTIDVNDNENAEIFCTLYGNVNIGSGEIPSVKSGTVYYAPTSFADLQTLINNCASKIRVTCDVTKLASEEETFANGITVNKSITIDMLGHTITSNNGKVFNIAKGIALTLINASVIGDGNAAIYNEGTLRLSLSNPSNFDNFGDYAIDNNGVLYKDGLTTFTQLNDLINLVNGGEIQIVKSKITQTEEEKDNFANGILINKDLTITGYYYKDILAKIDAAKYSRIFNVVDGATLTLNKIILSNGNADKGAGVYVDEGASLIVNSVKFINNTAVTRGGAIYSEGNVAVNKSIFDGNDVTFRSKNVDNGGAAIYALGGKLTVADSNFTNNLKDYVVRGTDGKTGDLINAIITTSAVTEITGSRFVNNSGCYGGAIYAAVIDNVGTPSLVIRDSEFVNNTAYAGTIQIVDIEYKISDSVFDGNKALGYGSVGYTAAGAAVTAMYPGANGLVTNCTFTNNRVSSTATPKGGAIVAQNGKIHIAGSKFENNSVFGSELAYGGAICGDSSVEMIIENSNFTNNTAAKGAGVYVEDGASLIVNSVKFINNTAVTRGGAIYSEGNVAVNKSIFDGNDVTFRSKNVDNGGAAIYALGGKLTVADSNFTNNLKDYVVRGTDGKTGDLINAIITTSAVTEITGSRFVNNSGCYGGAIYAAVIDNVGTPSLVIRDSEFVNNTAYAGTIQIVDIEYKISDSVFDGNKALGYGSVGYTAAGAAVTAMYPGANGLVTNCTFTNNRVSSTATPKGGAIVAQNGKIHIAGSKFENNSVFGSELAYGGAICGDSSVEMIIENSNFTNNTAAKGGAIYSDGKSLSVSNSNFKDNNGIGTIYNNAELTLAENKIQSTNIGIINDKGTVTTTINAIFLENKTLSAELGDVVELRATLTDDNGNAIKDYNFKFSVNGKTIEDITFDDGVYTTEYIIENVGEIVISTDYVADNLVKRIGIYEVPKAHITEFKVYVNKNEFKVGETVTVNVILRGVNDLGLNGDVVVILNNVQYTVKVNNGIGSFDVSGLASNTYAAFAFFNGDDNYNVPVFDNVIFKVMEPDYVISISVDDNVKVGEDATVKVSIPGASGVVKIIVDGAGTIITLDETGKAEYLIPNIAAGEHSIIAIYDGDETHNAVYNSAVLKVAKFASEVSVAGGNVVVGQDAVIKVSVTDGATGVVMIEVAGAYYSLDLSESDEISISLPVGEYSVVAKYMGDDKFDSSVSSPITVVVADKQVAHITIEAADVKVGEDATVSVSIPGASGVVKIIVDGVESVVDLDDGGKVSHVVSGLAAGEHSIVVVYDGDANYKAAHDSAVLKVAKFASEVSVAGGNVVVGQDAVIKVSVTDGATGVVMIEVAGAYYSLDLSESDEISISLPVGEYSVVAKYMGDDKFDSSVSSPITVVVADKQVAHITIEAADVKVGENAEVTITLPSDATGFVNVIVDGKDIGKLEIGENGTVKVQVASLKAGSHTIDVVYDGDDKYEQSSSSKIITVAKLNAYFEVPYSFTRYAVDYYGGERGAKFYAILKDENGNVLANKTVQIAICGPIYTVTTDEYGRAGLTINLATANRYTYALSFQGDEDYNAAPLGSTTLILNKKTTAINVKDLSFKSTAKTKTVSVKLTTIKNEYDGKTYLNAGKKITLKVNGKTYTAKTDANGVAKFNIQITKKGTYTATVNFAGDQTYKASAKSMKITIK